MRVITPYGKTRIQPSGYDDAISLRKNSTGSVFTRRIVNLIEGTGSTLTVADDDASDEIDVTIAAATSVTPHTLLDGGAVHTDTSAQTASRGSLICGGPTTKWTELTLGAADALLGSDGTDAVWFACTATGRAILDDATASDQLDTLGLTADGKSLVTAFNYAFMRSLLDLEAGTDFYSIAAVHALFQPLDSTLSALAIYNTNGILTQTAADTFTGRTITGTANQLTVTNGDGVSGNPTLSLPADVLIPTVLTAPNTGLHLLDTDASHDLIIKPGSNLTADHTLTVTTGDADRTLTLSGNADITGTNTGDQTSIVGITGTIAQFNTACTDANFAPTGLATASGLTVNGTLHLLGNAGASNGPIQEISIGGSLTVSGGSISVTTPAASAASQAEQETGSSTTVYTSPGRQQFHPSACKAWVESDSAGTLTASYNVASVTDEGTGKWTVVISTDMSSANYVAVGNAVTSTGGDAVTDNRSSVTIRETAAGSYKVRTTTISTTSVVLADVSQWYSAAFGDQ